MNLKKIKEILKNLVQKMGTSFNSFIESHSVLKNFLVNYFDVGSRITNKCFFDVKFKFVIFSLLFLLGFFTSTSLVHLVDYLFTNGFTLVNLFNGFRDFFSYLSIILYTFFILLLLLVSHCTFLAFFPFVQKEMKSKYGALVMKERHYNAPISTAIQAGKGKGTFCLFAGYCLHTISDMNSDFWVSEQNQREVELAQEQKREPQYAKYRHEMTGAEIKAKISANLGATLSSVWDFFNKGPKNLTN